MTTPGVTVYMTGWCPYCQRALALLESRKLAVTRLDVEEDPSRREEMIARSGRRTVPQIFIGDRHVGGCDDLLTLEGSGELTRIIEGA